MTEDLIANLTKLRDPAKPHELAKLPKGIDRTKKKGSCHECGGYHEPASIHLDYMGHAAVTSRLLDVDPTWTWEPVAFDPTGLPALTRDKSGNPVGLWIKLTICGVTRLGYGSCDPNKSEATKELIGDAIRNAGMRFGVGLELWHKGELQSSVRHDAEDNHATQLPPAKKVPRSSQPTPPRSIPDIIPDTAPFESITDDAFVQLTKLAGEHKVKHPDWDLGEWLLGVTGERNPEKLQQRDAEKAIKALSPNKIDPNEVSPPWESDITEYKALRTQLSLDRQTGLGAWMRNQFSTDDVEYLSHNQMVIVLTTLRAAVPVPQAS